MSSFSTYLIGFIVLIIGLAIAAYLLGVSQTWHYSHRNRDCNGYNPNEAQRSARPSCGMKRGC